MFKSLARTFCTIGEIAQALADFSGYLLLALFGVASSAVLLAFAWGIIIRGLSA